MSLQSIEGIGPATEEKLEAGGVTTVEQLADADATSLAEKTGVAEGRLEAFVDRARAASEAMPAADEKPKLLSGGNPQIEKGDGDAPVQAYIEAMPGWKRDVGRRLDALVERNVPDVRKAVRWNSPFYGVQGQGWFLSFHCFTKYVKVTLFRGTSMDPVPPVESKDEETRYFHVHEYDRLDEELVAGWIRQAAELPGEQLF